MNTDLISSRFLSEATNQRWSSFLHEATGKTAGSLGVGRRGTTGAATAADGTVTRSSQAAGRVWLLTNLYVNRTCSFMFGLLNTPCFIRLRSLDPSESYVLGSAGFDNDHPVNS